MKKILLVALIIALGFAPSFSNNASTLGIGNDTSLTKKKKEEIKNLLIGEWSFTGFSMEVIDHIHDCGNFVAADNAFLKFDFDANGTYTKTFGNKQNETVEVGTWNMSKDANQVILNTDKSTQILELGDMGDEKIELTIDIDTAGLDQFFCAQMNVLTFNKNILPVANPLLR